MKESTRKFNLALITMSQLSNVVDTGKFLAHRE
jgi:hypothetical protein